jgi:hypothetical protein
MGVLYVFNAGRSKVRNGRSSSSVKVKTQRDAQKGQKIYLYQKSHKPANRIKITRGLFSTSDTKVGFGITLLMLAPRNVIATLYLQRIYQTYNRHTLDASDLKKICNSQIGFI